MAAAAAEYRGRLSSVHNLQEEEEARKKIARLGKKLPQMKKKSGLLLILAYGTAPQKQ